MISVRFQGKTFNITVIQVYAPTSNAEAEVEQFYEDLQDLLELTPKKDVHYRGLECKSRKSRNTWSNRQIWPWSTECSRAKANRVLPRECTGHSKYPLPTTQEVCHIWLLLCWGRFPLSLLSGELSSQIVVELCQKLFPHLLRLCIYNFILLLLIDLEKKKIHFIV